MPGHFAGCVLAALALVAGGAPSQPQLRHLRSRGLGDAALHESSEQDASDIQVWPLPAKWSSGSSTLLVRPSAEFFASKSAAPALLAAFKRYGRLCFPHSVGAGGDGDAPAITGLDVEVEDDSMGVPQIGLDEAYTLSIHADGGRAVVRAKTLLGALHGLETFSQLVVFGFAAGAYEVRGAPWEIEDKPRFPHRGLMVDTSRHFLPLAALYGIIDSLPYAKLNVLHWHVSDEQSFPLQSKTFPRLWDGAYSPQERYTQEDVADVVAYAAARGIRVLPEFDMPGHAASWCAGYPEICPSAQCKQPLNVAANATWSVIEGLLEEVTGGRRSEPGKPSGLWPDNFLHLGGDEVDTACWVQTPSISLWLAQHSMTPTQAYGHFTKRAAEIAISKGRRPVQWSEVFDAFRDELPKETVVHIWKGNTKVSDVVSLGYDVILNVGYNEQSWYLDNLGVRWDAVYAKEPCEGIPSDDLCSKVLGGHGQMWGETVDASDLQQTVWPRLAAIAERLWSPRAQTADAAAARPRIQRFRCLLMERGVAAAPVDADGRAAPSGPGACGYAPEDLSSEAVA